MFVKYRNLLDISSKNTSMYIISWKCLSTTEVPTLESACFSRARRLTGVPVPTTTWGPREPRCWALGARKRYSRCAQNIADEAAWPRPSSARSDKLAATRAILCPGSATRFPKNSNERIEMVNCSVLFKVPLDPGFEFEFV